MSVWLGARPDVVGFADVPVPPTSHDVAHDVGDARNNRVPAA
jgi:hypothetical protein